MRRCIGCGKDISHQVSRATFCYECKLKRIDVKLTTELKKIKRKAILSEKAEQELRRKIRKEQYNQRKLKNPERAKYLNRHRALKGLYNITPKDYDAMFFKQNGRCAICKNPAPSGKYLHVDHDHKTGNVRGLLCPKCNTALGLLEHAGKFIEAVKNYLNKLS